MKYLVVNADDFGASSGVNQGILEAHRTGIVTSTSLMTEMPGSEEAALLAREFPNLSVGLHVCLSDDRCAGNAARTELEAQLKRFIELMGRLPTHLDSHHHVHPGPHLLPEFQRLARRCGVPLRGFSGARYFSRFYGRWAGESHPEQVSVAGLVRLLSAEVGEGVTELGCHPGHPDPTLTSSYASEREQELHTLCDTGVRRFLEQHEIALLNFDEASALMVGAKTP
jgi:chitin disaccharide deacetylase